MTQIIKKGHTVLELDRKDFDFLIKYYENKKREIDFRLEQLKALRDPQEEKSNL